MYPLINLEAKWVRDQMIELEKANEKANEEANKKANEKANEEANKKANEKANEEANEKANEEESSTSMRPLINLKAKWVRDQMIELEKANEKTSSTLPAKH